MITFIKKLLGNGEVSTKRFIAIIGTFCICIYTFISNDAVPITTIVMTAIGGNVAEKYVMNNNQTKQSDTDDKQKRINDTESL